MRRLGLALALWLVAAPVAMALPSKPPSVILSVGPQDRAKPLVTELTKQLIASKRFTLPPPMSFLGLDQPLTAVIPKLRKYARADWAFIASIEVQEGSGSSASDARPGTPMTLVGRVIDLEMGDTSKDLRFTGTAEDPVGLARDLVRYFKSLSPLHGEITGVWDDRVLLNIGAEDGVEVGSLYTLRTASARGQQDLGAVRVVSTEPWFSAAEIVARRPGQNLGVGMVAVEDLGFAFLR